MVLVAQSFADLTTQAWRRAYESLDEAERLLRDHCTGVSWELSLVHISRISILRIQGQYGEAVRRGLSVLAEARHRGDIFTQARIGIFVLVDQHLLAGRFAEGRQVLRELSREWFRGRFPVQQVLGFFHDINIDLLLDAAAWPGGGAAATGRSSSARRCCASRSSATTRSCCAAARRLPPSTTSRRRGDAAEGRQGRGAAPAARAGGAVAHLCAACSRR